MNTARIVVPTLLLLYFLWRATRQRVFLLGVPFLMDMYYSVFFDRLKIFWIPGQWGPADHMMFWLIATWLVYFDLLLPGRRRAVRVRLVFGPRLSPIEEVVLLAFAAYVAFKIGTTALHYMDLGTALGEARIMLYVFGGYLLLRGIFSHAGRKQTVDFLAAIVVVNSIAAVLYVLHQGLHQYIYVGAVEYQYLVFDGQTLTRSFYFMPQYLTLAIAFCAAKRTLNLFWIGVLAVNLAAVWVSYTRALVLTAIVEILVVLVVRLLKRDDAGRAIKRVAQIGLLLVVFVVAALALLPTQSAYLLSRISEVGSAGSAAKTGNVQVRMGEWRTTYDWVGPEDRLLGVGFPSAGQDSRVTRVGEMSADLVWVPTIWNFGEVGIAMLGCLFFVYAYRAGRLSFSGDGDAALIATVMLGVVVGTFLLGFVEWTVFDPWHTPNALWFFALVAAESCRRRAEVGQAVGALPERLPLAQKVAVR